MPATVTGRRFLGLNLTAGVSATNMLGFYLACLASIMLASFIPQSQPFILTEYLQIPESRHGLVSGMLNFWAEIVIIVAVAIYGPLSDRIGRRPVVIAGFAMMAAGTYLYPHATSLDTLLAYRLLYSLGIAGVTAMIVILVADYVRDESRGKATGLLGVANGLGAMITVFLLLRLPQIFQNSGLSAAEAGVRTYTLVAAITLVIGVILALSLRSDRPVHHEKLSLLETARQGWLAARDPGVALAYGASFLARGNLMIVGTFFTLWVANYGTAELGLSRADALAKAGMIVGIAQGCALLGAPVFGILTDKLNRVDALIAALVVSAIGYGSTFWIHNPFEPAMIACAIFIGLGEIGCIITSGVLIAQQTPERIRGSAIGVFTMSGAIGILAASVCGGYLYDLWRPAAPFVLFGGIAALVLLWALMVRTKIKPEATNAALTELA